MSATVISGSGLHAPMESVSNAELVKSHELSVARFNREHAAEIEGGEVEERVASSDAFIVKASGIHNRRVVDKVGVLDPERLRPRLPLRSADEPSIQCEMSLHAIRDALARVMPEPRMLVLSATSGEGLDGWVSWLRALRASQQGVDEANVAT